MLCFGIYTKKVNVLWNDAPAQRQVDGSYSRFFTSSTVPHLEQEVVFDVDVAHKIDN